jgi:hypothetical protein
MAVSLTLSNGRALEPLDCLAFHRDGFLAIEQAWSPDAVREVRDIVDGLYQTGGQECGALGHLVKRAPHLRDTIIFRTCLTMAKQLLGRTTRFACDNALYKEPHGAHGTPWHQDGAFHGRYFPNNTLGFWVPLVDVTPENGCMRYIPLEQYQILLPHHPYYPNDTSSMMTDHVDPTQAIVCPIRAGGVLMHGPLTLHAASANQTDAIRRTWLLTFRPWGTWGCLAPSRLLQRARLIRNRFHYRHSRGDQEYERPRRQGSLLAFHKKPNVTKGQEAGLKSPS